MRPGVRSARSGPKSVSGYTVEARDEAGGRLDATRRAALSGRAACKTLLDSVPRKNYKDSIYGVAWLMVRF